VKKYIALGILAIAATYVLTVNRTMHNIALACIEYHGWSYAYKSYECRAK